MQQEGLGNKEAFEGELKKNRRDTAQVAEEEKESHKIMKIWVVRDRSARTEGKRDQA